MLGTPARSLFLGMLPLLVAAPTVAATIDVNPGDDLAGAINSANAGDTILIAAGTFDIKSAITIPSGVTVSGVSPDASKIVFKLPSDDQNAYGFTLPPNASNITIQELDLVSNRGVIAMEQGSAYTDIVISHNNLRYGGGEVTDGTMVFGISGTIPNNGLQIVHNFFHDSTTGSRNWCVWYAADAHFDYNLFNNISDGGQIDDPGPHVSFNYNYGTYIHRMGQEVALVAKSSFDCIGNVFYDYVSPFNDTEGVSIVGVSREVNIDDNYFNANIAPGGTWGQADTSGVHRFGYAIEATGNPCTVYGNTIVGTWAECVSSDIAGAKVEDNCIYGTALWGDLNGEPGPVGDGSIRAVDNLIDADINDAPDPPPNLYAGPRNHSK
jgi:hypothetical protein